MDGILIFVRIAIFIDRLIFIDMVSFIGWSLFLQPDPNYTSAILLTKITQQLAEMSAGGQVDSTIPPPFQLQTTDVRVNTYWFLSLVFGLACALAATLVYHAPTPPRWNLCPDFLLNLD
jgi:hypothetical protein